MGKNISNNKSIPSRSKFTKIKLEARVKQEFFLDNIGFRVMKSLHLLISLKLPLMSAQVLQELFMLKVLR